MTKKISNPFIWISILIYILACFMPAYIEARDTSCSCFFATIQTDYVDKAGWCCFLDGLLLPFALITGSWGTSVWIANIYYFGAIILAICSFRRKWFILMNSLMALSIGSTLMYFSLRYVTRDAYCWVVSLLSGYYLWLLSFFTLFIGLLADNLPKRAKQWLSFVYSIGMIPACAYIIVPTLDKGDNSIEFDEKSQSLVADKSLQALIIDDGTHKILLQGQAASEHTIALKDLYSLFTPTDKKVTPIMFNTDNIYEIYNTTYVRAPQQKIRIEINANGKAKSVEIPKEEGDNSFLFDMKSQNFLTSSYFDLLIINDYNYLYWIDFRGLKRNNVSVHELKAYYEESNDTILPIYANQTYIINNWTHRNKDVHRIMIHLNEKGDVDSVRNLPPTKNIEKRAI